MAYCRNCGNELPADATYCSNCGKPVDEVTRYLLSGWGERFVAWLIDMIILGIILGPWIPLPGYLWGPRFLRWIPYINFGTKNLIYFLYWTFMEGLYGRSVGKMVMKIKVTQLNEKPIDIFHAAVESVGKAFLLPIDCIIGWIVYPKKKQRLFNYISETIVVKTSR
jgi:uncharacterized RDD family membrane protein YckC